MQNPYLPIYHPLSWEQSYVLLPELSRQASRAHWWAVGRQQRLAGLPCSSTHGAYLEGWYSVPPPQESCR